jgi:MFS family permease
LGGREILPAFCRSTFTLQPKAVRLENATLDTYQFSGEELPKTPGSPYTPRHPLGRRIAYAVVGCIIGACSTFPNALTSTNVGTIAGSLGLYVAEATWLPALYYAMNAGANLTLVKARTQFGIPAVTLTLLGAYALSASTQLAFPSFGTAVLVRIVNGITAAGMVTLSAHYFLQVFPQKVRSLALMLGMSLPQLGIPLARLVPVELLSLSQWRGLHLIELAVPLGIMTCILVVPLPPNPRSKVFQNLDLLTIALAVPALILGCEVLSLGRVLWWTDTPWIGGMLAGALVLGTIAALIETNRARPLIRFEWIGSLDILRFAAIALLVRLALAEQTFGSVGLLSLGGLVNDQLHTLFLFVLASMVAGVLAAALTLSERNIPYQVLSAALIVSAGAFIDSGATSLTRPPQLYLSQSLIGFGTTLFIGPAILYGFAKMLAKGTQYTVTLLVVFSITQNVGALAGSALAGSLQIIQTHAHASTLANDLPISNPQIGNRIRINSASISGAVPDPALRQEEGASLFGQSLLEQANVLAFDDVNRFLSWLSFGTACFIAFQLLVGARRSQRREATVT